MVSIRSLRVYLDSNTVIYALEGVAEYANLKNGLLVPLDLQTLVAVTSKLAMLEALVFPSRHGDLSAEARFRAFFTPAANKFIESIDEPVIEKAIELRAKNIGLKTPDAIHIATGLIAGCDAFVTADRDWSKTGIRVIDPADIG